MSAGLEDKVIIITGGGGRGLGRAMALGFALAGAAGITITAAKSPDQVQTIANEIDHIAGAGCALLMVADVTSRADCKRAVKETVDKFGAVHVLVNNAGKGQNFIGDDRIPFCRRTPMASPPLSIPTPTGPS